MTLHTLTYKQKAAIPQVVQRRKSKREPTKQKQIGEWAVQKLNLTFSPSEAVISRLLSEKLTLPIHESAIRRQRQGANPFIKKALANWVHAQYSRRVCVNGLMIKQQGTRILQEVNQKIPSGQELQMGFSNGWLSRFQKRWNLRSRKMHREGGDAVMDGIDEAVQRIKAKMQQFNLQDIWNADATGLFFCMPPDRTISSQPMLGRKKEKKRMTLLVCTNSDGSQKMPLMIIGNAHRPRAFKRRLGRNWDLIIGAIKWPG